MSEAHEAREAPWLTGSPWQDMRAHAILDAGPGLRAFRIENVTVLGRQPEWMLTTENHAGLLLPATREEQAHLPATSRRIHIQPDFWDGLPWIRIVCLDRDLEDVFLRFCEFVLKELLTGVNSSAAVSEAFSRFRLLFEPSSEVVDDRQIAGLMTELATLKWLLEGGIDAVPGWLGPSGETHDFVLGRVHLEVKSLPASGERRFHTSNIHQLEEPGEGSLYLLGARLAPGRQKISDIFAEICRLAPSVQRQQLEQAMAAVGCPVPVPDSWNERGFTVGQLEAWRIDEEFPRIVPSMLPGKSLPAGVSEVRYTVSLESATANAVNLSSVLDAIDNDRE